MGLTSALFTGLSGLDVNQTSLATVGNNIANANTVAFKSSRTIFTPQFYVTDSAGSAATANFGGQNPSQYGLGASVGSIQKNFAGGSIQSTGNSNDVAINGEGFFVVQSNGTQSYTRAGAFTLNSNDQLVTSTGSFVMGYSADSTGNIQLGQLGQLSIPLGAAASANATGTAGFTGNLSTAGAGASVLNSQALTVVGGASTPVLDTPTVPGTLLTSLANASDNSTPLFNVGDVITVNGVKGGTALTPSTFTVTSTSTLSNLLSFYNSALGTDTSAGVTGTKVPTPGSTIKTDGTTPNAVDLVIAGNVGAANVLTSVTTTTSAGASINLTDGTTGDIPPIASNPAGDTISTSIAGYDSIGNPITVNVTATLNSITAAGTSWTFNATSPDNVGNPTASIGTGTILFDTSGKFLSATTPTVSLSRAGTGANTPQNITFDFSHLTGLTASGSTFISDSQDGFPIGKLNSFSIGQDGTITGAFSNGLTRPLGQLALATFKNQDGLTDNGGNIFSATAASGTAIIGTPGQFSSGTLQSGALEGSNVDLSQEFTNLIVASTGFSAASRVISTSNQLIQDLLNSAR
jgi:flagellar hook protein FlgE